LTALQPAIGAVPDIYLVSRGELAEANALQLAQKLRHQGLGVELDLSGSAFGKQFKRADRSGAAACLILGEDEAAQGTVQLKWLASGEQTSLSQANLLSDAKALREQIRAIQDNNAISEKENISR
jgi:histidyl-tRNA synthetase